MTFLSSADPYNLFIFRFQREDKVAQRQAILLLFFIMTCNVVSYSPSGHWTNVFEDLWTNLLNSAQLHSISDPPGLLRPRRVKWLRLGESISSSWPWALRSMVLSGTEWFSSSSSTVASSNGRMTPCWHYLDISRWNRRRFTEKGHMIVVNFLVELIT